MPADGAVQAVLFSCLLLAASLWDIRKRVIPDAICFAIALTGLLTFTPSKLFGVLLCLPLLIAALIKEGGIGGGDIKFTAASGLALGFWAGLAGMVIGLGLAVLFYAAGSCFQKCRGRAVTAMKAAALPLAPFLSAGFLLICGLSFGKTCC